MSRYLIQSTVTGRFLAPSPDDWEPIWVRLLSDAKFGIVDDLERVAQLIDDYCDFGDSAHVIDLDDL